MPSPPTSDPEDPALEAALDELFAAPFPSFVDERKRLVVGLRAAGHKAAASALSKVNRPTLASWAINQLVRRSPVEVSSMFASAAKVRLGDFSASGEHRQIVARLSAQATEILREHGQPMSEATLRRITTSLQALSAYGDFAPDAPGRMIGDRDPPGFDAMALGEGSAGATLPLALPVKPSPAMPAATPVTAPAAMVTAAATGASEDRVAPPSRPAPVLRLVPRPVDEAAAPESAPTPAPASASTTAAKPAAPSPSKAAAERAAAERAAAERAAAEAAAEAEAAEAAAAERAVAEAARALAAAQEAARAAAARVQKARQRAILDELRTKQRRAAGAVFDHEQAIALMERELEQRRAQLAAARHDAESLLIEIARISAELAPEPGDPPPQ